MGVSCPANLSNEHNAASRYKGKLCIKYGITFLKMAVENRFKIYSAEQSFR